MRDADCEKDIPRANDNEAGDNEAAFLSLLDVLKSRGYAFTAVTPESHARVLRRPFAPYSASLRDIFGWNRWFERACLPEAIFDTLQANGLLVSADGVWRSLVRVASLGDNLFVHSDYPTAAMDAVFFGPDTYRFARAIHRVAGGRRFRRIVDIGCGSGAAGILLARSNPGSEVFLCDLNDRALSFARANVAAAGLANASCVHSDLLHGVPGTFDLIVANPPYLVDTAHRAYRDGGGVFGIDVSLAIVDAAIGRLESGGSCLVYTGAPIMDGCDVFRSEIETRLRKSPVSWIYEEIDPDVFGEELDGLAYREADRIAVVTLHMVKAGDADVR